MGFEMCCNKKSSPDSAQSFASTTEKEIAVQKYSSTNDAFFTEIEKKYNILTYIQLVEYINLLEYFTLDTATVAFEGQMKTEYSSRDEFLTYIISVDEFQSFIENKILKVKEIYEMAGNNELMVSTFKSGFIELYNSLKMKLNQHYQKEKDFDIITKRTLIPLGILFAISNIVGKIKLIFDIFKDENGNFTKSNELDEFLLSSFLLSSYCMISTRRKISKINSNISELGKDDLIKCLQVSELKDCENLVNIFNQTFFEKESYSWPEFKEKFEKKGNGFQWILSPSGIRSKLEENNV